MWRCDYCRARFDDRDTGINHVRARHSRDYTACRQVDSHDDGDAGSARRIRRLLGGRALFGLPFLSLALVLVPILAV
jgi:hypothetical protein